MEQTMASDSSLIGEIVATIGTDTLPYVPPTTAALLKAASSQDAELLDRVLQALRRLVRESDPGAMLDKAVAIDLGVN
jgi:hypothetical protein